MPTISGLHHLSLTVRDVEKSAAWWTQIFGMKVFRQFESDGMTKVLLHHPDSDMIFGLTGHGAKTSADAFSEFRTGMDHFAFAVPGRGVLEEWKSRFEELGVEHSEIKPGARGDMIVFRDPDNIQGEVYADEGSNK